MVSWGLKYRSLWTSCFHILFVIPHSLPSGQSQWRETWGICAICACIHFKKIFFYVLFLFESKRDRAGEGEGQNQRERHTIPNRLQALSCQHRAPHRAQTHRLRDHDLSRSRTPNRLSHPGAPSLWFILNKILCFYRLPNFIVVDY